MEVQDDQERCQSKRRGWRELASFLSHSHSASLSRSLPEEFWETSFDTVAIFIQGQPSGAQSCPLTYRRRCLRVVMGSEVLSSFTFFIISSNLSMSIPVPSSQSGGKTTCSYRQGKVLSGLGDGKPIFHSFNSPRWVGRTSALQERRRRQSVHWLLNFLPWRGTHLFYHVS